MNQYQELLEVFSSKMATRVLTGGSEQEDVLLCDLAAAVCAARCRDRWGAAGLPGLSRAAAQAEGIAADMRAALGLSFN